MDIRYSDCGRWAFKDSKSDLRRINRSTIHHTYHKLEMHHEGLFASSLDILGLFFVASLTISVIIQVLVFSSRRRRQQWEQRQLQRHRQQQCMIVRAFSWWTNFSCLPYWRLPFGRWSALWLWTTTDRIEDLSTIRYTQNKVQKVEATTQSFLTTIRWSSLFVSKRYKYYRRGTTDLPSLVRDS
jgi:hypothetical protein